VSLCANGDGSRGRHNITDGGRRITIPALSVAWGDQDIRGDWTGSYEFCSFQCVAEQAQQWAAAHDGRVLVDGKPPEEDAG
jgi:hypothetical protein